MDVELNSIKATSLKRNLRILIDWHGRIINFGTFDFKKDGTLVYSSAFRGHHVSLHPNEQNLHSCGQVLHIKQNSDGKIILSKSMNWFPVKKEFLLMRVVSPPLDECIFEEKQKDFRVVVPDDFNDSLEMWVRIFPWADSLVFDPQPEGNLLDWILGYNLNKYWVACGIFKSKIRSSSGIFISAAKL